MVEFGRRTLTVSCSPYFRERMRRSCSPAERVRKFEGAVAPGGRGVSLQPEDQTEGESKV